MRVAAILAGLVFLSSPAAAQDIPRDGKVEVPTKDEATALCRKNPYINTNMLLAGCVRQEMEAARSVIRMLGEDGQAASEAYWNCARNEFIDTYALLDGCMRQELEAADYLRR